ncbi:MAG: DNA-binding protein [Clostridia bacterium]|nr:DNA-binding protein [Clostridia bacterium]
MFEKDMNISFLLDFYGDVLSDKQRTVLSDYYNEDLSLAEIAQNAGITRQGARHIIKKAEEELIFLETKLGLANHFLKVQTLTGQIVADLKAIRLALPDSAADLAEKIAAQEERIRTLEQIGE